MRKKGIIILLLFFLAGCAVKTSVKNEYKLAEFSCERLNKKPSPASILITEPQAVTGYRTEAMLYMIKPFELSPFARNAWVGAPADMLFPLIIQSLQSSSYFSAVVSAPYAHHADYRLDTQLIELQQSFLLKPSRIEMSVKAVVTYVNDSRVIASQIFTHRIPCPEESPYGGVLAANNAAKQFTADLTKFVINAIERDNSRRT